MSSTLEQLAIWAALCLFSSSSFKNYKNNLKVTALIRNPAHKKALQDLGVEVVRGSSSDSDTDLIASYARTADISFNQADSDDVGLNTAILAGQKARVVEDKKAPAILVHTSGVAIFADGTTDGRHDPNAKVWNDGNEADIRSINAQMMHGTVDVEIMRAAEEGYTVSYIVFPRGIEPIYVGEGLNVFYMVRLDDLVNFYGLLFEHALSGVDAKASPYSRYYIAASAPLVWKHTATVVGATLKKLGRLEDDEPESVPASALQPPGNLFVGMSQNVRGERANALGWKPRPVVLEDWVEEGIVSALAKLGN
ncbi:hypothetical protein BC827DRAFT_1262726 [Russula dissimulans]|nr:hypothetical protein BC827DRAFT_1262726 [Russula dissimulans]